MRKGEKIEKALSVLWRNRRIRKEATKGVYEVIVVQPVLYESETNARNTSHVEAAETRCLRSIGGVSNYDKRNERSPEITEAQRGLGETVRTVF